MGFSAVPPRLVPQRKGVVKMAKNSKLPGSLKAWRIVSSEPDGSFIVSKKGTDGKKAVLKIYELFHGESYTSENRDFAQNEADFIKNLSKNESFSNYLDVAVSDNSSEKKLSVYVITEQLTPLSEYYRDSQPDDREIVDFGIQIGETLEKLEENKIFHGNINPDNIYVTPDNKFKLGGFCDFENDPDNYDYAAPEIPNNKPADFTTDLYSLGLVLYSLSNNGKLPFEGNGVSRSEAVKKRLSGAAVSAPENGNQKLKSVIMIACQPENKNRWKNAGNIKNAFNSIMDELPAPTAQNTNVIVPEGTDFYGNVFDEYEYDESSAEENSTENEQNTEESVTPEENEGAGEAEDTASQDSTDETETENTPEENGESESDENDNDNASDEPDEKVFDDYTTKGKITYINQGKNDYGDFFEEEKPDAGKDKSKDEDKQKTTAFVPIKSNEDNLDVDSESEFDYSDPDEKKKSKKGLIAAIIGLIAVLLALGGVTFCAFNGMFDGLFKGSDKPQETTAPQTTTAEVKATTAAPTTAAPTTAEPTTEIEETTSAEIDKFVTPVVGYYYDYAKELLENEGFVVQMGSYEYSTKYEAGKVIAQYPSEVTIATTGSVVTLDVSAGLIDEPTNALDTESEQSSQNESSDDSPAPISEYKGNNSYMSKSEVEAMSDSELNLALNEIYARRGRIFTTPSLSEYFNSQSWYTPKYSAAEFDRNVVFNDYEQKNLQLMINEQQKRGIR